MKHGSELDAKWLRRMTDQRIMIALESCFAVGVETGFGQQQIGEARGMVTIAFLAGAIDEETYSGALLTLSRYYH